MKQVRTTNKFPAKGPLDFDVRVIDDRTLEIKLREDIPSNLKWQYRLNGGKEWFTRKDRKSTYVIDLLPDTHYTIEVRVAPEEEQKRFP